MLSTALIEHILATAPHRTVGVLGDLFLDRYLDIDARLNEPSVETGLTAYQVTRVRCYPGAAGTVINNLAALGVGKILPIAYIGDDGEGYELRKALPRTPGVEGQWVSVTDRHTPTYTKPMLNEGGNSTELNRLDTKNRTPTPREVEERIIKSLEQVWPLVNALLVLDQVSEAECGVVTRRVRDRLADLAAGDPGKFVLADSREQIARFRNVCAKPNEREVCETLPDGPGDKGQDAETKASALASLTKRDVFLTRGAKDILLVSPEAQSQTVPTFPVSGPIDIVGAGDSCSAGIAAAIVSGTTHAQAASFGNLIASITIQQIGVTGTASPQQVRERWREIGCGM